MQSHELMQGNWLDPCDNDFDYYKGRFTRQRWGTTFRRNLVAYFSCVV
jgi:hypothetical protein